MKNQRWVVPNTESVEELQQLKLEALRHLDLDELKLATYRGVNDQKHRETLARKTDVVRFIREVNALIKRMNIAAQRDLVASSRRRGKR